MNSIAVAEVDPSFVKVAEEALWDSMQHLKTKAQKKAYLKYWDNQMKSGNFEAVSELIKMKTHRPVPIREFIESPEYLNTPNVLYPIVMDEIEKMNCGDYVEAVLTGAIGTGKTTIALFTTAYQLYLLSLYENPQAVFGLDPSSEIVFIFQSITAKLAEAVDYARFKSMIEKSPYFKKHFMFDQNYTSEMRFPNRIIIKPVSGSDTAAIGQNVIGGVIDELNFMAVTENSKMNKDGGTYDQAVAVYNSISRRRKSRFMKQGRMPGILCLVSSVRYPGQFTDVKEAEARKEIERQGFTSIYVYHKTTWEIKPPGTFTGEWFDVFVGDGTRRPHLLEPGSNIEDRDQSLVIHVPEEYRSEFETDIMNAIRDIAGISTLAHHPFILVTESITQAVKPKLRSIFSRKEVDFVETQLQIYPKLFKDPKMPRFAHVDLAISGDSAGVALGYVDRFMDIDRGDHAETLPHIVLDGTLEVYPPRNGEILFWKIRNIFHALRKHGLNVRWITFDSFQSTDSQQLLRREGFITGLQSMDVDTEPYDITKSALYDGRVSMPAHPKLQRELASLERDVKKNKIDHPPSGSKDVADAFAGVIYGLTMRREIWALHRIPLINIPPSISTIISKPEGDDRMAS